MAKSSQVHLSHLVELQCPLICWYPLPSLLIKIYCMDARWAQPCLIHTARKVFEVPEALEFNQVREVNLKTHSHWTILRGVHFMLWCLILGGSHGWLFEQEKFLSHPPFSPSSLSPHCPKRVSSAGAPPSVLSMSSLFDVVAAMTTGSRNMILAFLNKDMTRCMVI